MGKQLPPAAIALRRARAAAKFSQQELADRSGVSKPTIANIERGVHKTVRLSTLEQLAASLQCDVTDLMGEAPAEDLRLIELFSKSEIAQDMSLQPSELRWLRQLRVTWQGGKPTSLSLAHLIEALRYAREKAQ